MRYRLLASYQGAPYEAGVGPVDSDVVLFAACPPPEELKFEPATGHWRKEVHLADVQTLHESRPVGMFRGERCVVLDDLNDRLHIVYLGHDAYRAEQIGYWEVDRGVFELITPRQEVTDIIEERLAFPHRGGGTWQTAAMYASSDPAPGHSAGTLNGADTGPQTASYPQSPDCGPLPPDLAGRGPQNYGDPGPEPQPPGYGSDITGSYAPAPGVTGGEPQSQGLAPGFPRDTPQTGRSDGDYGQALPGAGFDGLPGRGPASADLLSTAKLVSSSEPDSVPNLGSAPGFLTATDVSGVAMPVIDEPPLPLEAQARRAATAAHRRQQPDYPARNVAQFVPAQDVQTAAAEPLNDAPPLPAPAPQPPSAPQPAPAQQPAAPQPAAPQLERDAPQAVASPALDAPPADAQGEGSGGQLAAPVEMTLPATTERAPGRPPAAGPPVPHLPQPPAATQQSQVQPIATPPRATQQSQVQPIATPPPATAPPVVPAGVAVSFQDPPDAAPGSARGSGTSVASVAAQPVQGSPVAVATLSQEPPGSTAGPFDDDAPDAAVCQVREASAMTAPPLPQPPPAAAPEQATQPSPADDAESSQPAVLPRRRRAAKRRLPTQRIFSDLAAQAAIPASAYAVGEDVDGAMCLMRTADGFEVFNSAAGARHEIRVFQDEESAYFYLFGVLVADAVRTGALAPRE